MAPFADDAPFALSRATLTDLTELTSLEYDCFPPFVRKIFLGCHSRDELPKIEEVYAEKMRDDRHDIWIKAMDRESGKIIAASNWKIHVNGNSDGGIGDHPPPWLKGEEFEQSKQICEQMEEVRRRCMPGPFVRMWFAFIRLSTSIVMLELLVDVTTDLHICFTHADYRRRGAGGMMLQWGCDLADQLGLPAWIEASDEGNFLYKAFGFYDFEKIEGELGGTNMKRDARVELAVGGKPKSGRNVS